MLGNDVVDLQEADKRPQDFRGRFEARVFRTAERRAIARDPHPLARRWAHWAAKEAAYKLLQQVDPKHVFAPGRMQVEFEPIHTDASRRVLRRSERRGHVTWKGHDAGRPHAVEVRSTETEDYVHVIALPIGGDWGAVDGSVERLEATAKSPSESVRRLAIREIARSLGVARQRLSITPPGADRGAWIGIAPRTVGPGAVARRIPRVELDGAATTLSLSLSHHGRFVSFAMTPRIEPVIESSRRSVQPAHRSAPGATPV